MNLQSMFSKLSQALGSATNAVNSNSVNINNGSTNSANLAAEISKNITQNSLLLAGVYQLTDTLQNAFDAFSDAQKATAGLGRTFDLNGKDLGTALKGLDGTISQRLTLAITALDSGLNKNSSEVLKLSLFQKTTNQQYEKTIELFTTLQKKLGFSVEETNELAKRLKTTSETYGISTERLVASLDAVVKGLPQLKALSPQIQKQFADVITELQGQVGAGVDLTPIFQELFKPGFENYAELSRLGLVEVRSRTLAALQLGDVATASEILKKGFADAYKSSKNLIDAQSTFEGKTYNLNTLIGGTLFDSLSDFNKAIEKAAANQDEGPTVDFLQLILEAFDPLSKFFTKLLGKYEAEIVSAIDVLGTAVKMFVGFLKSPYLGRVLAGLGSAFIAIQGVLTGSFLAGLSSVAAFFGTTLTAVLGTIASAVAPVIGIIAAVAAGLYLLYEIAMSVYDGFMATIQIGDGLKNTFSILKSVVIIIIDAFKTVGVIVLAIFKSLGEGLGIAIANFINLIDFALSPFEGVIDALAEAFKDATYYTSAFIDILFKMLDDPFGFEYSKTGEIFNKLVEEARKTAENTKKTADKDEAEGLFENAIDLSDADKARSEYLGRLQAVDLALQTRIKEQEIEKAAITELITTFKLGQKEATDATNSKFDELITQLANLNTTQLQEARAITGGELANSIAQSVGRNTPLVLPLGNGVGP